MFKVFKGLLLCGDLPQQFALIYFREFQLLRASLPTLRQNREIIVDFLPNQQTCSYFGPLNLQILPFHSQEFPKALM